MPAVVRGNSLKVDLTDLKSKLQQLGDRMANNVVRRGILAGMGVVRTDARARVVKPRRGKRAKKGKDAGKTKGKALRGERPAGGWPAGTWSTGKLKKAISSDTNNVRGSDGKNVQVTGRVFVAKPKKDRGQNPRRYAHLVEFGVAPHAVGRGSKLKRKGRSRAVQVGIMHPGHSPRPFMRPAWDAKQAEAAKKIETVTREQLDKEIAKLARKGKR